MSVLGHFIHVNLDSHISTYTVAKVGPHLDNQAHAIVIGGLDGIDEDARLSACGVVHAHNASTKVLLLLGKVALHLSVAVVRVGASAVLERIREAHEAIKVGLRAPPVVQSGAWGSIVARESGASKGKAVSGSSRSRSRKSGNSCQSGEREQRGDHGCELVSLLDGVVWYKRRWS